MQIHEYTIHENFKNCKALTRAHDFRNSTVPASHTVRVKRLFGYRI